MENTEDKYRRLIDRLRENKPELEGADDLTDSIMRKIRRESEKGMNPGDILNWLFAWAGIPWLRNSLTAAMFATIFFFIFQFSSLNRKIDKLESRLIQREYNYYQSPYSSAETMGKYIFPSSSSINDSINVSRKDLMNLLNEYEKLELKSTETGPSKKRILWIHRIFRTESQAVRTTEKTTSI
ncbi:MAG: hypothetical protein H6539_05515 [Bacteroidales bacterium]|nr:hypothetical protein [Bacteroidales bacterium]